MKFDKNGKFIKEWGKPGNGPCGAGEFSSLHAIAVDSRGRLFIGDRDNNRIQLYDQDGNYLDSRTPSRATARTTARTWRTPAGSAAFASAARATAPCGTSSRTPRRRVAAAPPKESPRSTAARLFSVRRSGRVRSSATTGAEPRALRIVLRARLSSVHTRPALLCHITDP
jgi:hypothetical protein